MPVMPKYKAIGRTSTLNSILVYLKTFLRSELRYLTSISNMSKIKILIFTSTKLIPPLVFSPLVYGPFLHINIKNHRESSMIPNSRFLPLHIKCITNSLSILHPIFFSVSPLQPLWFKQLSRLWTPKTAFYLTFCFHYFPL